MSVLQRLREQRKNLNAKIECYTFLVLLFAAGVLDGYLLK